MHKTTLLQNFSPKTYAIALASGGLQPPEPLLHIPTTLVHPSWGAATPRTPAPYTYYPSAPLLPNPWICGTHYLASLFIFKQQLKSLTFSAN